MQAQSTTPQAQCCLALAAFFTKLAIKHIARRRGMTVKTSDDCDLTDYAALVTFVDRFVARAIGSKRKPMARARAQ